jgi:DNA mismatch repair protein MutS2
LIEIEKQKRDFKHNAHHEARQILSNANALIERTVREIKESQADKTVVQQIRKEVEQTRKKLDGQLQTEKPAPQHFGSGDRVLSKTFHQEGTVIAVSESRILVEMGNIKAELPPDDLTVCQKALQKPANPHPKTLGPSKGDVPVEIDVRGLIFDEAVERVDKYLDDAVMVHMQQARIIHGKGTGVLRKKLNDHFKTHPLVKSQRAGQRGEGDWGVTVVELVTNI